MIEAKVIVPKHIVTKGYLNSEKPYTYLSHLKDSINPYFMAWTAVILVDTLTGNNNLIFWHLLAISIFGVLYTTYIYKEYQEIHNSIGKEIEYHVRIDDSGVYIKHPEQYTSWDKYINYTEYDDYIQINGLNGVSFLPKTEELKHVIEFTKKKIPNKSLQSDP